MNKKSLPKIVLILLIATVLLGHISTVAATPHFNFTGGTNVTVRVDETKILWLRVTNNGDAAGVLTVGQNSFGNPITHVEILTPPTELDAGRFFDVQVSIEGRDMGSVRVTLEAKWQGDGDVDTIHTLDITVTARGTTPTALPLLFLALAAVVIIIFAVVVGGIYFYRIRWRDEGA